MAYTFSTELFSDLHKDVYGFRPRNHWFYDPETTDDERQKEWDYLCNKLEEDLIAERAEKDKAWAVIEQRVQTLKDMGAKDDQEALRWIVKSLQPSQTDLWYGGEWVCYELGLNFDRGYIFNRACRDLLEEMEREEKAKLDESASEHDYHMSFA